jgi:hypothetical protein
VDISVSEADYSMAADALPTGWPALSHAVGQACVFYGAAEFSRDTDLAILSTPENLERFRAALADLEAECIALPPFEVDYLLRGHALVEGTADSRAARRARRSVR